MSPSHHTRQAEGRSPAASIWSPIQRLVTPMVALTIVLRPAASTTSASTSRTRSSDGLKPATLHEQVGAGERLERVADRDPEHRHGRRVPGERVGERGAERDAGPQPVPPDHQRRERDARRRPDRRDARVRERELEARAWRCAK